MADLPSRANWLPQFQIDNLVTTHVGGLPIAVVAGQEIAEQFCEIVKGCAGGLDVHLVNAYSVALASRDAKMSEVFKDASLVLPDGKPLAAIARWRDSRVSQVRGPSFFEAVFDAGRSHNLRHFLLGSTPDTLKQLESRLSDRYPGVHIVGTYSPPFRAPTQVETNVQMRMLSDSGADIVWVGLGTPKQDFEAQQIAIATGLTAVAVGAAFDFSAGTKRTAPEWVSGAGLEWAFRLASEPRRLWRRYLVGNAQFLWAVVRYWRPVSAEPDRVTMRGAL